MDTDELEADSELDADVARVMQPGQMLCELSSPEEYAAEGSGNAYVKITKWRERILLGPSDLGEDPQVDQGENETNDQIDIHIERRRE